MKINYLLAASTLFAISMGLVLPRSNSELSCTGTSASDCNEIWWTLCSNGGEIVMPAPAKWKDGDCTPAHCSCVDPYAPTTSAQASPLPTAALVAMRAGEADATDVSTHTHLHTHTGTRTGAHSHEATFPAHTHTHSSTHTHAHSPEITSHTATAAAFTYDGDLHIATSILV